MDEPTRAKLEVVGPPVKGTPARLYDPQEVADILGVKLDFVRRRVQARTYPYLRIGRFVKFTEAHIAAIIASAEKPIVPPRGGRRTKL